jgi:hypothetical protein
MDFRNLRMKIMLLDDTPTFTIHTIHNINMVSVSTSKLERPIVVLSFLQLCDNRSSETLSLC